MPVAPRAPKVTTPKVTLLQFVKDKRRANCRLCALAAPIRAELKIARERKIPRTVQIEWLKTECGIAIGEEELDLHRQGRHDA